MSDLVSPCDSIEPLLGEYADGEIVSAADKLRIEAHLKECSSCTSDLAFFRATNFVISSRFPDVQPPIDIFLRTAQATYARPTFRARLAGWLAPAPVRVGLGGAFAAAVVIAVVVPLAQRQSGEGVRPLAQNELTKTAAHELLKPASPLPGHENRLVAKMPSKLVASLAGSEGVIPKRISPAVPNNDEDAQPHLAVRPPAATHAPARSLSKVAVAVTPKAAPAAVREIPTIVQKIGAARIVLPEHRDVDELARRGGMTPRTLPDGEPPREFVAPSTTVPIAQISTPAHETSIVAPSLTALPVEEPSSARSVVDPPAHPHGALHISLGGAGARVALGAIQGLSIPKSDDRDLFPGHVKSPTN